MTNQEMRIAIAEASGWKYVPGEEPTIGGTFKVAHWLSPTGERKVSDWKSKTDINLPDFLSDLNAMHEAEKTLQSENDRDEFCCYMSDIIERDNHGEFGGDSIEGNFWRIHTTARQRAEAFLRTINKWKD